MEVSEKTCEFVIFWIILVVHIVRSSTSIRIRLTKVGVFPILFNVRFLNLDLKSKTFLPLEVIFVLPPSIRNVYESHPRFSSLLVNFYQSTGFRVKYFTFSLENRFIENMYSFNHENRDPIHLNCVQFKKKTFFLFNFKLY